MTHVATVSVMLKTASGSLIVPQRTFAAETRAEAQSLADVFAQELGRLVRDARDCAMVRHLPQGGIEPFAPMAKFLAMVGVQELNVVVSVQEAQTGTVVIPERPRLVTM